MDFLWHSPHPLLPPAEYVPTAPTPTGTFFDQYAGGWQESLPAGNGTPRLGDAWLGLHGEVSSLPWDVDVVEDTAARVAVRFSVRCRRTPFWLRRTMALDAGALHVGLEETLVNEGEEVVPYVWGHHPAFGPPFLAPGCRLELPAAPVTVSEGQPHGALPAGEVPVVADGGGQGRGPLDASLVPGKETRAVDTLSLDLRGGAPGWAAVRNPALGLGVGVEWYPEAFPYVWCWQAYGGAGGYPYYGRTYHLAVEPFNAPIGSLEDAQRAGSGGALAPGEAVAAWLRVGAILGDAPAAGFDAG